MPGAGLSFSLRLDGLSLLFTGLIYAIGLLIVLYARYYLSENDPFAKFFSFLSAFMGAMVGIALSNNLLFTIIFWELTSLTSCLLIGYWQHRADARQGARMALAVTGMGGLGLLAGAIILGNVAGTYEISEILLRGDLIRAHAHYPAALLLILLGAFTKSAQFPFHFWLPNAMAAPTPVSAYLHSATMVKAGIFLLARLYPALAGTDLWFYVVSTTGMLTLLFAAYQAMFRHDLKGLLAHSTISHLGLIVLLLGLNSQLAAVAAVFHIINHATFKASLFMAAGIIDHETGTRDMRKLNGLWKYMPITGALAMVASAAMAGVPLLNGFLSKEMFFGETLQLAHRGVYAYLIPVVATIAATFSVAYSTRFIHDVFFNGEPVGLDRTPHEPPHWMRIPVEILVALCLLVGLFPQYIVGSLLALSAKCVIGGSLPEYSLAIWHGFNVPLAMSAFALVAGVLAYYWLVRKYNLHEHPGVGPWTGHRIFEAIITFLISVTQWFTRSTADGRLQRQVAIVLVMALAAGWWPFFGPIPERELSGYTPMNVAAICAWLVLAICSLAVIAVHRQRLLALVLTGAVGLIVSIAFAYFSAPDLALTQLTVEVATIILMLLALAFLPQSSPLESSGLRRARDGVIAAFCGIGMGAAAWFMMTTDVPSVSQEQFALSYPKGGGTNVVNVILVDFRGFDTYGEITVLAIAALGVFALVAGSETKRNTGASTPIYRPVMLSLLSRALVPLAILVSVYLFLRGHNLPGGGFIAGLVTSAGVATLYLANGSAWTASRFSMQFHKLIAAGLAVAGTTGIGAWLFDKPFLTSANGHWLFPLLGDYHWATAALFDLGVYLVVVGVVLLILEQLGRLTPQPA